MKTAIVYDWMDSWGGAERALLHFHNMFPEADWYTSNIDPEMEWTKDLRIQTSFIQQLPHFVRKRRVLSLLFYPLAFESFDFSEYDLVISVTSSFAKAAITRPETKHICYMLTPTRFLWSHENDYTSSNPLINRYKRYIKTWDVTAAQRPDKIIAISKTVKERINRYYNRDSEVLFPPFDYAYWKKIHPKEPQQHIPEEYYLVVSRLKPYKKTDLVIEAFNTLPNKNVVIVGKGELSNKLKTIAKSNITFVDSVDDDELAHLYSGAKALIVPQEEDFGYVSLEAQARGCPVIAFNKGGSTETILNNKTGIFFNKQIPSSIRITLEKFEPEEYTLKRTLEKNKDAHLDIFSQDKFAQKFNKFLTNNT